MHTRCLRWSALGGLLGASVAYAQAPTEAAIAVASDPLAAVLVELARVSPLAMVLAVMAFGLARLGPPTVRIVLVEDQSSTTKRLDELERLIRDRT